MVIKRADSISSRWRTAREPETRSRTLAHNLESLGDSVLHETAPVFGRRAQQRLAQIRPFRGLRCVRADGFDLSIEELANLDELGRPEVDDARRRLVAVERRSLAARDHRRAMHAAVILMAVLQAVCVDNRRLHLANRVLDQRDGLSSL